MAELWPILLQYGLPALLGLVAGVVGSLVAPWVNWSVEKRRSRLAYRQRHISAWRKHIQTFRFHEGSFTSTSVYAQMRPHLRREVRERLEKPRTTIIPNEARGEVAEKYMLLDEVARIEKEWGLV